MIRILALQPYDNSERVRTSKTMCSVAFEHAESLKLLLVSGNFTSAVGMLRLQFEALVRAVWIFYAALDIAVNKLSAEMNNENLKLAEKLPMLSEMLNELETKAPKALLDSILEFKESSWKPLNSYIHGGLHAVDRHSKGYPVELLEHALKASNGLNGLTGMFAAVLAGNRYLMKDVSRITEEFSDCLQLKRSLI